MLLKLLILLLILIKEKTPHRNSGTAGEVCVYNKSNLEVFHGDSENKIIIINNCKHNCNKESKYIFNVVQNKLKLDEMRKMILLKVES